MGLKQLALIHLVNKGYSNVNMDSIEVKFANSLVNVEDLDKIEFIDALVSTLGNLVGTAKEISEATNAAINGEALSSFLTRYLKVVNLENLFKMGKDDIVPPVAESRGADS